MKLYKIAVAVLALTLLAGCGKTGEPAVEATNQPTETTGATEQFRPPAPSGIPMECPYITLYCPEDWETAVEREVIREGNNYVFKFRLTTLEKPVELFSFVIGPDLSEGYYLGDLDTADGMIGIYSIVYEQSPEDWSEEDYTELCYQQERVNDLLLQIQEHSGFHAG